MGASYLTSDVTIKLYQGGLVPDRGLDCVWGNNDAVVEDKYLLSV